MFKTIRTTLNFDYDIITTETQKTSHASLVTNRVTKQKLLISPPSKVLYNCCWSVAVVVVFTADAIVTHQILMPYKAGLAFQT